MCPARSLHSNANAASNREMAAATDESPKYVQKIRTGSFYAMRERERERERWNAEKLVKHRYRALGKIVKWIDKRPG